MGDSYAINLKSFFKRYSQKYSQKTTVTNDFFFLKSREGDL